MDRKRVLQVLIDATVRFSPLTQEQLEAVEEARLMIEEVAV